MPLIPIAMALGQFAPWIVKMLTGSDKAEDIAEHVVGIAQAVTGEVSPDAALAAIKADPNKVLEFQQAISAQQADIEKAYLADVADARARDIEYVKAGRTNDRANVLAGAALLLVVVCLFVVLWQSNASEFAKATISLILGRALGWVEQLFSFEFGTTRANKTKDDTINNLTK
ncbi:hypothetical protein [Cupriavidus campinensis]|uniref:hypothetical protein n=1 Tax=Cupriavidus campinensis TaxID=151783 RepID=UPI0024E1D7B4|nr:hypothetical protein [Cupriavidus campinensis]